MRPLAEALHRAKFTVSVPLLAGHGTRVEHLEKTQWVDWYASAEGAFHELKAQCATVMVAGLSLGGLLAAHLAYRHPKSIAALALMATPFFLEGFLMESLFPALWKTPLKHLYKYQPKRVASIRDPQARRLYQTYEKIPVVSVASLLELQKAVRSELRQIRQPALLVHSLHDETVPYGNLDYARAVLASSQVETLTLKRSNHIITVDYDKDRLARRTVSFFKKYRKK